MSLESELPQYRTKQMIRIRTTLPKTEVTPEHRFQTARMLSRFLPNGQIPFPINDTDGAYVFDDHNDWWCTVDDDDSQLVSITYRDTPINHRKERAFAEWVCANRRGWQIVNEQAHLVGGTFATVSVVMDVWLPKQGCDPEELESITFDIPLNSVDVFLEGKRESGAILVGYTTQTDVEVPV